jgi:hypothetical protein
MTPAMSHAFQVVLASLSKRSPFNNWLCSHDPDAMKALDQLSRAVAEERDPQPLIYSLHAAFQAGRTADAATNTSIDRHPH